MKSSSGERTEPESVDDWDNMNDVYDPIEVADILASFTHKESNNLPL